MFKDQNKNLNSSQLVAVKHKKGPLLIVAGAGTGKTTVITERIKYLIVKKRVKPSSILALTFTEKAAAEMLERLDFVMPLGYEEPWLMTFHSFGERILREEGLEIGLSTDYKILDQANQWILLRKNLFDLGLDYYLPLSQPAKFINALIKFFSRLQDEDVTADEFISWLKKNNLNLELKNLKEEDKKIEIEEKKRLKELAHAYKSYQEIKIKKNQLDFGDLITWTLKLFRQRPAILKKYQEQFEHILVDEFQDTNWAQLQLIKLLAPPQKNPNLVVVGDDDQAIYRWRGAAVTNILEFKKHYPQAKTLVLTKNYRSGQKLLNTAYQVIINNNPERLEVKLKIDKKLEAVRGKNLPLPQVYSLATLTEEADFVCSKILELAGKKNYNYKDFAILARANNHLDPFLSALRRWGIPYQLVGNRGLFDQEEIRTLIFFAKAVVNPKDSTNFFQLLQAEFWEIKGSELLDFLSSARAIHVSLYELIKKKAKENEKLSFILKQIEIGQEKAIKFPTSKILLDFIQESGFINRFLREDSLENQLKIKNLNLFFQKLKNFEAENPEAKIVEFTDWLDLLIEAGENPAQAEIEDIETVSLMTVHMAKGLEFPVVFVVNCVADRFPTRKKGEAIEFPLELIKEDIPQGDIHLQEERRLFYVACTRAKDYLFLLWAKDYGSRRPKKPSPFILETKLKISEPKIKEQQLSWLGRLPSFSLPKIKIIEGKPELNFLSFSKIDVFLTCPLKYKYKYILQIPTQPHHALTFGQTVHKTLYEFHLYEKKGKNLSLNDLLQIYEKNFDENGYESEKHKQERFNQGKNFFTTYFKTYKDNFTGIPFSLEKSFTLRLAEVPLIGKIDRIDKIEDGFELIDYKTGQEREPEKVDKDVQLTIYGMAASWALNLKPIKKLSLYFIESNKKISSQRTEKDFEQEKEYIKKLTTEIKNSQFPPKANYPFPCGYCEYRLICPFAKKA